MDWSNERYVRLYTRDTKTWLKSRWEGQCLLMMILRKVDRAGVIDDIDDPVDDLALITGLPAEHVKAGIEKLLDAGAVEINNNRLILPNFIEAQEASKSDRQRQRESRDRRRTDALVTDCDVVNTKRDKKSQVVTDGHRWSLSAVPSCAVPSSTVTDDFNAFWSAYPKKAARKDAIKAWGQTVKTRPTIDVLLRAIRRQLQGRQWQDGIYPHAASWLRGERWNDEPERGGVTVGRPQPAEFKPDPIDDEPPATAEEIAAITGSGGVAAIEAREAEAEKE